LPKWRLRINNENQMLPRLYAIVDAPCFTSDEALFEYVRCLVASGVTLIQYRNKTGSAREMLAHAREIKRLAAVFLSGAKARACLEGSTARIKSCPDTNTASTTTSAASAELVAVPSTVTLIMNDRADLALAAAFDGVHVGQDDLSVEALRAVVGPKMIVGVSTHNPEQVALTDKLEVSYIAVGPVFATSSKANPDPVIGIEGVRRARELTSKPLIAIGGITRENAASVREAGADSVAVISDLLSSPMVACEEFLKMLG
jgi:thiamine-phosphate pyrophosphorylase